MIYISYGLTKSASTFLWLLTQETLRAAGFDVIRLSTAAKGGRPAPEDYVDPCNGEALARVAAEVEDRACVIKTHGPPDRVVLEALARGDVLANAVIRDPRDIALSLVDHGAKSRASGIPDFADFREGRDAFSTLDTQFRIFKTWTANPKVLRVRYDALCFDTPAVIAAIAAQLGAEVDAERVLSRFGDKTAIRHFNKGVPARYRDEMDPALQQQFLERYAEIYRHYL